VTSDVRLDEMKTSENEIVIYDAHIRWVAAVNLAFAVGATYGVFRFVPNAVAHWVVGVFCFLFSLFWWNDFIFGIRLYLTGDGRVLSWQEGKEKGQVELNKIRCIIVAVKRPVHPAPGWTYIRFRLADGSERQLPPNMSNGLRARNWRRMKDLVGYVQSITPIKMELLGDPDTIVEEIIDEPRAARYSVNRGGSPQP